MKEKYRHLNLPPGIKQIRMIVPRPVQVTVEIPHADGPLGPVRVELGDKIAELLADHGYETMEDIAIAFALGDQGELLNIKGIGPKTVESLEALAAKEADEEE